MQPYFDPCSLGRWERSYNYPNAVSTLLASITRMSGPHVSFSYADVLHDQSLTQIWHEDQANQTTSKFAYGYDVQGQITKWTQQAGTSASKRYELEYDPVRELKSAMLKDAASGGALTSYYYDYDGAGNRTLETLDNLVTSDTPNNLNQLRTRQAGHGVLPIRGTTNEPAFVTVNGTAAVVRSDNSFEGTANVATGDNVITVAATDANGNTTTSQYNVVVTGSGNKTLIYDLNGNLTSDGTRSFEWDPLNRLTAVNSGTRRSEFTYNGLNQRVKILEKENNVVTSTKHFISVGSEICEERDASNVVSKRYYREGFTINSQQGTTHSFFTRDHLGSIREVTDSAGAIQARYDYDPYGRQTKLSGSLEADFGFTGHYNHRPSALHLTLYRAYDADLGRWLNRDPIAERGGLNLYEYVLNDPVGWIDPLGLSNDTYVPDNSGKHGGPHIDRYNPGGQNVGRYRPDGSGIPHKGKPPPPIPNSDQDKFNDAAGRCKKNSVPPWSDDNSPVIKPPPIPWWLLPALWLLLELDAATG